MKRNLLYAAFAYEVILVYPFLCPSHYTLGERECGSRKQMNLARNTNVHNQV